VGVSTLKSKDGAVRLAKNTAVSVSYRVVAKKLIEAHQVSGWIY
jgi:hypothetical protein